MSQLSNHAESRLNQRGIRIADVDFLLEHGTRVGDRVIFSRKDFAEIEREAKEMIKRAERMVGKCVIVKEDVVVTGFHCRAEQAHELLHK